MKKGTPTLTERAAPRGAPDMSGLQPEMRRTGFGRLRSTATLVATIAVIALLAGVFALLRAPAGTGQTPGGQPTVRFDLPPNSQLSAVSMDSQNDGWAVGTVNSKPNGMGGPKNALLAHFDGKAWTTSPNSANFPFGQLISVSMVSASEGWAAGSTQTAPDAPIQGLLLHYTGGHWRAVDISNLGFMGGGQLTMRSANDGWLVAQVGPKSSADRTTLVLHYHDGAWSRFTSLPGPDLVSMLSATDGWAADQIHHTILRYQNGAWKQMATAPAQPLAMTIASPSDVWLGGFNSDTQDSFVMHYDGQIWMQMALPNAAYSEVDQMASVAPGDVWIFGRSHTDTQAAPTIAWHYSGVHWALVSLNFQAYPTGASMISTTSGWITGNAANNTAALLRYNDGVWIDPYYGK
ncbi:MAG TPA: hypothetical protein VFN78_01180 [Ktedonobacterales bacterium]|nr:hypothetical protein [Ktedonobacterales bacterium]